MFVVSVAETNSMYFVGRLFTLIKVIMAFEIPSSFTAIDFETAGSARATACALGIVVVEEGQIIDEKSWLINPEAPFNYYNVMVHGITERHVKNAPKLPDIWSEITPFINQKTICAHNLSFDQSVLSKSVERYGLAPIIYEKFCTLKESKARLKHLTSHKLNDLAHALSLGTFAHHDALADAKMCAKLAIALRNLHTS
jgi:DNA polymerase-3 subunit epsilon